MDIKAVVGRNVRRYRELKGISQEDLAFDADLHRTYVSGVERGVRNPTVLIVGKLANALGVAPCKLLEFNESS
jgi:transcriptional regulator with XRE-family HTH domain